MKRYDVFAVYDKASWVAGERINLNGTAYPIAFDEDAYYLNTGSDDIPSSLLAVYPSDTDAGGNDVTVTNNGVAGKAIATGGSISLCVPVTVNRIKSIVVTGYDTEGRQLFTRSKTLDTELQVQANTMYTIPVIEF